MINGCSYTYHAFDVWDTRVRNEKLLTDIQSGNLERQMVWNATTHAQCSFWVAWVLHIFSQLRALVSEEK